MLKRERLGSVHVTPAEKAALQKLAALLDRSQAATVRRLIRLEAERQGLWPEPATRAGAHD